MIPNYTYPQSTIAQLLQVTTPAAAQRLNAVIIGPHYRLTRYGIDAKVAGTTFLSAGQDVAWQTVINGTSVTLPTTDVVDLTSVGLYAESLQAVLANYTSGTTGKFYLSDLTNPAIIQIRGGGSVAGTGLDTLLYGRPVAIGDTVTVNDGVSGVRTRTVIGLIGANVASTYGSDGVNGTIGNSIYNPVATSQSTTSLTYPVGCTVTATGTFNGLVAGAHFSNSSGVVYGEDYSLTVVTPGAPGTATFNITSADGLFSATNVASTAGTTGQYLISSSALGGLSVQIATLGSAFQSALLAGQVFRFQYQAAYARLGATQLALAGTYTGPSATTYVVQVSQGTASGYAGAILKIYDTAGIDTPSTVTVVDHGTFSIGSYGLTGVLSDTTDPVQGGLRTGDSYFITANAASQSTTTFDRVLLSGPASDTTIFQSTTTPLTVTFSLSYTGVILPSYQGVSGRYTTDPILGIVIPAGLSHYVATRSTGRQWIPFTNSVGNLFPSFRSLVPPGTNEDVIVCATPSDISANFGSYGDMANDLSYGVEMALAGSQGLPIHVLRVAGTDVNSYNAAFQKISATSNVYALSAVSSDMTVGLALQAHVVAMSQPNVQNFRRGYFGTDSPVGLIPVLVTQPNGSPYSATVSTLNGQNVLVTCTTTGVDFTLLGLAYGDTVTIPSLGQSFLVNAVISATELTLQSGPSGPISPATAIQVYHANTPQNVANTIISRSKQLNSRRISHVWQESGNIAPTGVAVVVPNRFVACEMAGLRVALFPQQGLTRTEVSSITNAPAMYLKYTSDLLDQIAANGTWIVTQRLANGPVFVRHQLTTDSNDGSLYYEDSVGVVLDYVSLSWFDIQDSYIGKQNATPATVANLTVQLKSLLDGFSKQDPAVAAVVGPMLVSYSNISVAIGTLKDSIITSATLTMGLPLNYANTTFEAVTLL